MLVSTVVVAACAGAFAAVSPLFTDGVVGIHQKSVARSIAKWGDEYSQITDTLSAIRAARMIGYINDYYVTGDGYRSTPDIEQALQAARTGSLSKIVGSLESYTGLKHGLDPSAWVAWADSQDAMAARNGDSPESAQIDDEQTHATEPAAGSAWKSTRIAPAR